MELILQLVDLKKLQNIAKGSGLCDLSDQKQNRVSNVIQNERGQAFCRKWSAGEI